MSYPQQSQKKRMSEKSKKPMSGEFLRKPAHLIIGLFIRAHFCLASAYKMDDFEFVTVSHMRNRPVGTADYTII